MGRGLQMDGLSGSIPVWIQLLEMDGSYIGQSYGWPVVGLDGENVPLFVQ